MTNPPYPTPLDPVPEQPRPDFSKEVVLENLATVALATGAAYLALCPWIEEAEHKAQQDHMRGERLAAYRVRHRWKAGDVRPLLSIGVNEAAQRHMVGLKGKGRPVVRQHRPLNGLLRDKLTSWLTLLRDEATPDERRRSFKSWPWWKRHVEALYRGELEQARGQQIRGAHDHAERTVAHALRVSQGTVHAICGEIRAMRLEDAESANFPPMTLTEHERWMERGELPKRLNHDSAA